MLEQNGQQALALNASDSANVVYSGTMVIRYGARYLGKPHLAVVPGLIAIDYGDMLTGDEAWDFLIHRSNLYPRAEVFGYRNDGRDEMITVKLLDLAQPIAVLVYESASATIPIAAPSALIAPEAQATDLPSRLLGYLPRYDTASAWLAAASG